MNDNRYDIKFLPLNSGVVVTDRLLDEVHAFDLVQLTAYIHWLRHTRSHPNAPLADRLDVYRDRLMEVHGDNIPEVLVSSYHPWDDDELITRRLGPLQKRPWRLPIEWEGENGFHQDVWHRPRAMQCLRINGREFRWSSDFFVTHLHLYYFLYVVSDDG